MAISKRHFGTMSDGTEVNCWKITGSNGCSAEILDYGVTVVGITVPDREGNLSDVVLGYDDLNGYLNNGGAFGATVGRFANRIAGASFTLNGKTWQVTANAGEHHIHGGDRGFHRRMWQVETEGEKLIFSRLSPDGEEGYPGNMQVKVTVFWEGTDLLLQYWAISDQDTVINLTNHSYFNLDNAETVDAQYLQISAEHYVAGYADGIPTGTILPVEGSAMDFRQFRQIGARADASELCVSQYGGYDSCYVLTGENPAAVAYSPDSGIQMSVYTDQPGVQLYTANHIKPRMGKSGKQYAHRCGFCLETQHYPDCMHHSDWPSCVLKAGEIFHSYTKFSFTTQNQ